MCMFQRHGGISLRVQGFLWVFWLWLRPLLCLLRCFSCWRTQIWPEDLRVVAAVVCFPCWFYDLPWYHEPRSSMMLLICLQYSLVPMLGPSSKRNRPQQREKKRYDILNETLQGSAPCQSDQPCPLGRRYRCAELLLSTQPSPAQSSPPCRQEWLHFALHWGSHNMTAMRAVAPAAAQEVDTRSPPRQVVWKPCCTNWLWTAVRLHKTRSWLVAPWRTLYW